MKENVGLLSSLEAALRPLRRQSPLPVQIGYGWLRRTLMRRAIWHDKEFCRYYAWLQETQWWSREQLADHQLIQLRGLLKHAYENVPYYRRVFDEHHILPDSIATLQDLQMLPFITRSDVRDNLDDLVARNVDRSSLSRENTGGSTSQPLTLYHYTPETEPHEKAFMLRQWCWAGYHFGDPIVTLRGWFIPELNRKKQRLWWYYSPNSNELRLSVFDMSEELMCEYIEKIREFGPRFIYATPSSLQILSNFMRRRLITDIKPVAIFCESETLSPWLRGVIESQWNCRVFAGYGMTERVVDAVECECHAGYHINMEYGIFELVDEHNGPITKPGIVGRVVGTGLDTYHMPLIRYLTDDLAAYAPDGCTCGRESPLVKDFLGRTQEFAVSKTGRPVSMHAIILGHTPVWAKIGEIAFLQEMPGELVAQVVRAPGFSDEEVALELIADLKAGAGAEEFDVRVVFVDKVPRTQRGKIGILEQRLQPSFDAIMEVQGGSRQACA